MVERRLTRRDQAGLLQPANAGLLASAGGARETHGKRETTAASASFFAFLSHIARSQHKRRISTSDRSRGTSAGDWQWRVYTNNVATSTTNGADPSDTWHCGHFLTWMPWRAACPATQMWANFSLAGLSTLKSGASYPSPSCPHAPSLARACANVLFAHVCHACCVWIHLSSRIFAYGPRGGLARTLKLVRACALLLCDISDSSISCLQKTR